MKKEPLYNQEGRVDNPDIAQEMAETEKPYRESEFKGVKKIFFSKERGEKIAEDVGEFLNKTNNPEIDISHIKTYEREGELKTTNVIIEEIGLNINDNRIKIIIELEKSKLKFSKPDIKVSINKQFLEHSGSFIKKSGLDAIIKREVDKMKLFYQDREEERKLRREHIKEIFKEREKRIKEREKQAKKQAKDILDELE